MTDKKSIRDAILNSPLIQVDKKIIHFFGQEIEIRQPTIAQLLDTQELITGDGEVVRGVLVYLIKYAYVPGTDDNVFDMADLDVLKQIPYNADVQKVVDAMNSLGEVKVKAAEGN